MATTTFRIGTAEVNGWVVEAIGELPARPLRVVGPLPVAGSISFVAGCPCPMCQGERFSMRMVPRASYTTDPAVTDETAERDLSRILDQCSPREVMQLRTLLRKGKIDGSSEEACVVAWIARMRGQDYEDMPFANSASVFERWLGSSVRPGQTPENSAQAALLDRWLLAWLDSRTLELPGPESAPDRTSHDLRVRYQRTLLADELRE